MPRSDQRAPQHPPRRNRRQSVRIRLHPPAPRLVKPAQWQFDRALVGVGAALDHGPVGLAHLAVLEQKPQMSKRLAVAPEHETSRGVLVEAVRQRGRAWQAEPEGIEIVLKADATLGSAMHRKAGGL